MRASHTHPHKCSDISLRRRYLSQTQIPLNRQTTSQGRNLALEVPTPQMVYYVPELYGDVEASSGSWAAKSTRELCAATRKTGNHVCRSDVCHKGKIGRYGFCRLGYWHWVRGVSAKGEPTAVRAHGLSLQSRGDG